MPDETLARAIGPSRLLQTVIAHLSKLHPKRRQASGDNKALPTETGTLSRGWPGGEGADAVSNFPRTRRAATPTVCCKLERHVQ